MTGRRGKRAGLAASALGQHLHGGGGPRPGGDGGATGGGDKGKEDVIDAEFEVKK